MSTFYDTCSERIKRLIEMAIHANQTYATLRQVLDLQNEKNDIINLSPAFYHTLIRNFVQSLFIETAKMFTLNNDSDGIRRLINDMNNNIQQLDMSRGIQSNWFCSFNDTESIIRCFPNVRELTEQLCQEIDNQTGIFKRVRTQRDQYYAHFDRKKANKADFFLKNKVSYQDFQELLLLNMNICNSVYMYFHNATVYPVCVNYDDFNRTIWYVEKGMKKG